MFWVLKEPSHREGSFEYPQHMYWMRNIAVPGCHLHRSLCFTMFNYLYKSHIKASMQLIPLYLLV